MTSSLYLPRLLPIYTQCSPIKTLPRSIINYEQTRTTKSAAPSSTAPSPLEVAAEARAREAVDALFTLKNFQFGKKKHPNDRTENYASIHFGFPKPQ